MCGGASPRRKVGKRIAAQPQFDSPIRQGKPCLTSGGKAALRFLDPARQSRALYLTSGNGVPDPHSTGARAPLTELDLPMPSNFTTALPPDVRPGLPGRGSLKIPGA